MDYEAPYSESELEAEAALSDMSISEEEDTNDGDSDQDEADLHFAEDIEGKDSGDDEDVMDDDDDTDGENDSDWDTDYVDFVEEHDDEINMEAYDTEDVNANGLQKTEQAGVLHLVHGWTQRGHPDEVCPAVDIGFHY